MIKLPAAPDPSPPKNLTVGGPHATGPELHPLAPNKLSKVITAGLN